MTDYERQTWAVDAPLTGVAIDRSGALVAFGGGDGSVRIAPLTSGADLKTKVLIDGAVLSLVPDCEDGAFLAGADDGVVYRIHIDGVERLTRLHQSWPDQLATHAFGLSAVADGSVVRVLNASGTVQRDFDAHPSTIAGMAFDREGSRLAVSHYDGASVWDLASGVRTHSLHFRGSHLSLRWRSDGRYLVTATQEKMLHVWDLTNQADASLGPSFNKVKSLGWSADGAWLLAAGNDTISAWSFAEGLPRPAPSLLGRFSEALIGQVCPHPILSLTAAGYNDGGLDLTALASRAGRHALIKPGTAVPVTDLAWSPDGNHLVGGTRDGRLFIYRFDDDWLARLTRTQ